MHTKRTETGFEAGAAKVDLLCSDDKKGWLVIGIGTPKHALQVYVTKTGKVRIWDKHKELTVKEK